MHAGVDLVLTLTASLGAALAFGYVTQRFGWSPIVGYLLGGVLVGPFTPGFVADAHLAEQLAEIGVILLMFGVGLQFHVEHLLAVWRVALPGAAAQSLVATGLGAVVARWFGWDWSAGLVFGAALSVASTVVLVRVLADNRDLHTPAGHIAVGWLVVEDLFTVLLLVVLPALVNAASSSAQMWTALAVTGAKVAGLIALTVLAGQRAIPWALEKVSRTRSRELFTLTVLVIALSLAVSSAKLFGVSMALGAFLAGMVVGRTGYSLQAASEAMPMRDAFAVLFFVSVGMLLDPRYLFEAPGLIAATLAVVIIGKPLIALLVIRLMRYPLGAALTVAVALAQIGEFSFILVSMGRQLGVVTAAAGQTAVAVAIVSIVANPLLYQLIGPIEQRLSRRERLWRWLNGAPDISVQPRAANVKRSGRAVVVGYGPSGRTLTRLLRDNRIETTVIERNADAVRQLEREGVRVVNGDAAEPRTLERAGVSSAASLVLSAAGLTDTADIIRASRTLNPSIHVLARTAYLRERQVLCEAGANHVFTGEGEVALALTEALLHRLGATPEQIERERSRAHAELFTASDDNL